MKIPNTAPIWERAFDRFQRDGLAGTLKKASDSIAAELLRARLKFRGRHGPARLAQNRALPITPENARRILFIRLWGLGDTVMTTPAMQMVRERFGDARIMMLGTSSARRVVEGTSLFDEFVVIPNEAIKSTVPSLYHTLDQARRFRPDLVVVAYPLNFPRVREALPLLGARWVVGPQRDDPHGLMAASVPDPPARHVVEINLEVARAAGCEGPTPSQELWLTESECAAAEHWLSSREFDGPLVCFHVGTIPGLWQKAWPTPKFVDLGHRLVNKTGASIVLLEGPDEREAVSEVAAELGGTVHVAGTELTLRETMALVARMDVVVAGSSVWIHVAAAACTPHVCVCGPTPPSYDPYGEADLRRVVRAATACAPCWEHDVSLDCPTARCMDEVEVEWVEAAVMEMLDARARRLEDRSNE